MDKVVSLYDRLTKKDIIQICQENGVSLEKNDFKWNKETYTFIAKRDGLIIPFKKLIGINVICINNCTIAVGNKCNIICNDNCTITVGNKCNIICNDNNTISGIHSNIIKAENSNKMEINGDDNIASCNEDNKIDINGDYNVIICNEEEEV